MATPIQPNKPTTQASGAQGADLLARLQAQAQGEAASNGAFNAWMSKHAMSADQLQAQPDRDAARKPPPEAAGTAATRDPNSTASKLLEQAIQRARQQTLAANRQAELAAQGAQQAANKPQAAPKARAEGKGDPSSKATDGGEAKPSDQAKSTDDAALVEELTPPPEVKADDAQAMMAWLASLTHGDAGRAHKLAAQGGASGDAGQAADTSAASATSATQDPRAGDDPRQGRGAPGTSVADAGAWQPGLSTTALMQTDAKAAFKDELSARIEAKGTEPVMGGAAWRAQPDARVADAMRPEVATLHAPVGSDAFAQALGDQLTMWIKKLPDDGAMQAELHLNPAELGPIHVKISLEGKDAQVDFAAAAVETRQAIEASMKDLSNAFQEAGLNLTGGEVSAQTAQQGAQQDARQAFDQAGRGLGSTGTADASQAASAERDAPLAVAAPRPGRAGGLDLYA